MSDEEKKAIESPPPPKVIPWYPNETIKTIGPVSKVENLPSKGFVLVRRMSNLNVYCVETDPDRDIPIDSKVVISEVLWDLTSIQRINPGLKLLVVTNVLP